MSRTELRWCISGLAWICAVVSGFAVLVHYETSAGQELGAPSAWPADTSLARATDRPTLLMFVHPLCPCSRASLVELRSLLQRVQGKVEARVLFVLPEHSGAQWDGPTLREIVRSIPDLVLTHDIGGAEAARFRASTSGMSLLYDPRGRLQFAGGITSLRGHEGDSFGQERIVTLVNKGAADKADSPVFGCLLKERTNTKEAR